MDLWIKEIMISMKSSFLIILHTHTHERVLSGILYLIIDKKLFIEKMEFFRYVFIYYLHCLFFSLFSNILFNSLFLCCKNVIFNMRMTGNSRLLR